MSSLRFWSKGMGNKYLKRVSEHLYNTQDAPTDDKVLKSKEYLKMCEVSRMIHRFSVVKQNTACGSSIFTSLLHDQAGFTVKNLSINNRTALSQSPILQGVSTMELKQGSLSMICASPLRHFSTNATENPTSDANSDSGKQSSTSQSSVLDAMGLERESAVNDRKNTDERSDHKDKTDENNTESAFLRSQRMAKWMLLATFGIGGPIFINIYGAPKVDEFGEEMKDSYSDLFLPVAYMKRAWSEVKVVKSDIVEPSSKKLLPDPLTEPYYQPPYTLVIELMDVFLRPVYDSITGWRFKKRPGIEYFLSQVGPPLYEIVIFTRETGMTAYPLIESMDQKGYIMYRLFRDSARYKSGFSLGNPLEGEMPKLDPYYQKDLRYLNRNLKRVILVDCDKRAFEKQPENGLCLEKWDGSSSDSTLYDLAGLLRAIATSNVDDVRPVLQHYSQNNKPIETFKQAQIRMQEDSRLAMRANATTSQLFAGAGNTITSLVRRR